MRKDLDKVITDRRPHYKKTSIKGKRKEWQRVMQTDEGPSRESSHRNSEVVRSRDAVFDDATPLFRFLLKKVGTDWDKVYSEIKHSVKKNSPVDIPYYLNWNVEIHTSIIDGKVYDSKGEELLYPFYVHPVTKVLCKNEDSYRFKSYKYHSNRKPPYVTVEGRTFAEIDGIWYEIEFQDIPGRADAEKMNNKWEYFRYRFVHVYDVLAKTSITPSDAFAKYGKLIYAQSKKQVNGKTIKQLGLREHERKD